MTAEIRSARNPRVQLARRLVRDAAARRSEGLCVLEGPRIVQEYLDTARPLRLALVSPRLDGLAHGPGLLRRLEAVEARSPGTVFEISDDLLGRVSDTRAPQGALLVVPRPREAEIPGTGSLLVAWRVADPGNVGSLVRTAEASGCSGLVLVAGADRRGADPFSPRALRGAAGSAFRLPIAPSVARGDALPTGLGRGGRRVVALVPRGGVAPDAVDLAGPVAIVVGGETAGLPAAVARAADVRLTIPIAPPTESLNVGAAAAVACFEAARQRRRRGDPALAESPDAC